MPRFRYPKIPNSMLTDFEAWMVSYGYNDTPWWYGELWKLGVFNYYVELLDLQVPDEIGGVVNIIGVFGDGKVGEALVKQAVEAIVAGVSADAAIGSIGGDVVAVQNVEAHVIGVGGGGAVGL